MAKLTLFIGLPASGKSSEAERRVLESKGKTKRVERDLLRQMLDVEQFNPKNERIVTKVQHAIISTLLDEGLEVIVSDTNLNPKHRNTLLQLAMEKRAIIEQDRSFLDVPLEECIKRDLKRVRSVGEQVIRRMFHQWISPHKIIEPVEGRKPLVICDLDGTLADLNGRNPYDASTCEQDILRTHVWDTVNALVRATGADLYLFSGRQNQHREQTLRWLNAHNIVHTGLFMRADKDARPDTVIKEELFKEHVSDTGRFNVIGVFDDRPSVVRLWRSLHLPVFDVGFGVDF